MGVKIRITYDSEVDVLYIRFHEATVTTKHFDEGLSADYDADGRLSRIEVLRAAKCLGDKDVFKRIVLENIGVGN